MSCRWKFEVIQKTLQEDNQLSVSMLCEIADVSRSGYIHSDQGCHYTSTSFIQLVNDKELRQSMSRRNNCWDNAPQESFFGHMKDEIDVSGCTKYQEVKTIIDDWMDYYNSERYQWQLAKLSPNEYYGYITTGIIH